MPATGGAHPCVFWAARGAGLDSTRRRRYTPTKPRVSLIVERMTSRGTAV
jgi:hypothetical protein